jgi:DNA-binding response OmpR family regulator
MVSVLVVDDDAALLRLLRVSLRDSGFDVRTAMNGEEALEQVGAQQPEVIVLDLEMPVMDGRAFYREMRARGCSTPVLILSAFDARRAQRELNADAWMNKPFDPDELSRTINKLAGPEEPETT